MIALMHACRSMYIHRLNVLCDSIMRTHVCANVYNNNIIMCTNINPYLRVQNE